LIEHARYPDPLPALENAEDGSLKLRVSAKGVLDVAWKNAETVIDERGKHLAQKVIAATENVDRELRLGPGNEEGVREARQELKELRTRLDELEVVMALLRPLFDV
jgi:pheromone shutdown protein TraB